MRETFELNAVDSVIALAMDSEYNDFCENLRMLDEMHHEDLFSEAVKDPKTQRRKDFDKTVSRTVKTTKDVAGAYNNITDAGGDVIKSIWDLAFGAITLTIRVISFILRKISLIPKGILAVANKVASIPTNLRDKIRGNVKIYITAADLQNLYNQSLLRSLDEFIAYGKELSTGSTWGTFFSRREDWVKTGDTNGTEFKVSANDISTCKKMRGLYVRLKLMEFEESTVEMNKPETRNIYFGTDKSISFTDLRGQQHQSTYFDALVQLMKDIQTREADLRQINEAIGNKYDQTMMNQQFTKLPKNAQNLIAESIQMISKVISIVGNIIKCITSDMNTIKASADKILSKQKVKAPPTKKES